MSLLQQPLQNSKYASTVVIQGRSGYSREKPRSRLSHYSNQMPSAHYQSYSQPVQSAVHAAAQGFEARPAARQSSPQLQYLQPSSVDYKAKSSPTAARSFKLPSPPLVPVTSQQVNTNYPTHQVE